MTFSDNVEQRNHYKLDWHRYNLKRALVGSKPVTEDLFLCVAGKLCPIFTSRILSFALLWTCIKFMLQVIFLVYQDQIQKQLWKTLILKEMKIMNRIRK